MKQFHRLSDFTGYGLNARDGEIGKLEEIYFDDQLWVVRYFIVDTGSWLTGRKVLILPAMIDGINEDAKTLEVYLTRKQIENCPSVNTELPVSRYYEQEYYEYYGREPYWGNESMFGPATYVPPPIEGRSKEPEDPHLRSSNVVKKYDIHASDGNIGHVEDFILGKEGWVICYLEINTRKWLPGKHVLIVPAWIRQFDWVKQEVMVDLTREAIKTAPSYDPSKIISDKYQAALFKHYGLKLEEK